MDQINRMKLQISAIRYQSFMHRGYIILSGLSNKATFKLVNLVL